MCADCCTDCFEGIARTFLYCTNLLVFLASVVVLGLSIWFYADPPSFANVISILPVSFDLYTTTAILLICLSVFVIIITFFGCCGAARDNRCMLWTYFILVLVILIGMGVGTYFVLSGNVDALKQPFLQSLETYNPDDSSGPAKALVDVWDDFQSDYQCCGVDSWQDWNKNPHFDPNRNPNADYRGATDYYNNNRNNWNYNTRPSYINQNGRQVVPQSCCNPSNQPNQCALNPTSQNGLYSVGCFQMVVNEIDKHETVLGIVAISVLAALLVNCLIAIYMATCGYHSSRPKYRYGRASTHAP